MQILCWQVKNLETKQNKTRKEKRTREATIILKELLWKSNLRPQDDNKKTKYFTHLYHLHKRGSIIDNFR